MIIDRLPPNTLLALVATLAPLDEDFAMILDPGPEQADL
jgi:hypothetical protein